MNSSAKASGTALAPKLLNMSMYTGFCITRSLMPWKSSKRVIGRLVLVTLRKPFSQ
ncbi:hypothetical protein D3C71_2139280 [compost metagenome]